jgi:site-specific DNA-adenine methylase
LHEIVVNKCQVSRDLFPIKFDDSSLDFATEKERRLAVMQVVKKTKRFDMEQLERLQRLQRLQQLQQLEQLQQLQQLQQLVISNISYSDVEILTPPSETIIYLDPPYINKAKYSANISHESLYEYIDNSPYKIYLSSYEAPYLSVLEMSHRSTLSATNNSKKVIEKLFTNQLAYLNQRR